VAAYNNGLGAHARCVWGRTSLAGGGWRCSCMHTHVCGTVCAWRGSQSSHGAAAPVPTLPVYTARTRANTHARSVVPIAAQQMKISCPLPDLQPLTTEVNVGTGHVSLSVLVKFQVGGHARVRTARVGPVEAVWRLRAAPDARAADLTHACLTSHHPWRLHNTHTHTHTHRTGPRRP
jgi:hypothetical protein